MTTKPRKVKYPKCIRCGVPREEKPISRHGTCLECGIHNAAEATRQMANKSGPIYDRWVAAQKRYARNLGGKK